MVASWLAPGRFGPLPMAPGDHPVGDLPENAIEKWPCQSPGRPCSGCWPYEAQPAKVASPPQAGRCPGPKPPPRRLSAAACVSHRRRCQPAQSWPNSDESTTSPPRCSVRQAGGKLEPFPPELRNAPASGSAQQGLPMRGSFSWMAAVLTTGKRLTSPVLVAALLLRNGRASFRFPLTGRRWRWRAKRGSLRKPLQGHQARDGRSMARTEPQPGAVRSVGYHTSERPAVIVPESRNGAGQPNSHESARCCVSAVIVSPLSSPPA